MEGILIFCMVIGGLCTILVVGDIVMTVLEHIPPIKRIFDKFFDSLPMNW